MIAALVAVARSPQLRRPRKRRTGDKARMRAGAEGAREEGPQARRATARRRFPQRRSLVSYTGWLYDRCKPDHKGEQFDTSKGRSTPFGFIVGAGRVIKGWDEGLHRHEGGRHSACSSSRRTRRMASRARATARSRPIRRSSSRSRSSKIIGTGTAGRAGRQVKLASTSFADGGAIPAEVRVLRAGSADSRDAVEEPQSAALVERCARGHEILRDRLPRSRRARARATT